MQNLKRDNETIMLTKQCDINVAKTIKIAHEMIKLAQAGYEQREDDNCGILYGILLDSGYRLLALAEKEKHAHAKKGWWNNSINNLTKKEII
ncbi:MAG: hypothetical protein ABIJ31_00045 [Pseudomonadota bacterium]